ncbi:MAG: hypothetical protein Q8J97_13335, partial [Flavobacteriaceae bacterium]|nr:hypothetical protein [Flavobacteriaceae bacterium]
YAAQRRRRVLIGQRDDGWLTRRAWERLHFAALVIQCTYRRFRAVRRVAAVREQHYRDFVVLLQRWGRQVTRRRDEMLRATRDATRQRRAAVTIQKTWRRYEALLTYSVLLLKKKIATMRRRELRAAQVVQRVARAFQSRRATADAAVSMRYGLVAAADTLARQRAAAFAASQRPLAPLTPPHLTQFLEPERRHAARAQAPVDRALYMELAVEPQRARIADEHSPGPSQRANTLNRAAEAHRRSLELGTLRRFRAAKTIQRFIRRCRTLDTPERRSQRMYARAALQKRHFDAREAARIEAERRAHVHATIGDPALGVRELLEETRAELHSTPPVRRHLPDDVLQGRPVEAGDRLREIEEREAAARRLR